MSEQAQIILFALTIVSTIIGAWAYQKKKLAEAQADEIRKEGEAKLIETQSDADQIKRSLEMLDKQILINRQTSRQMRQQRLSAEEGYSVIRGIQNDTNIQLANLYNAMKELRETMADSVEQSRENATLIGSEIGMVIARQLAMRSLDTELFPFPKADDLRWRSAFLIPAKPDVWMHKQPFFDDAARVDKPCAKLRPDGEKLQIIDSQLNDWIAVVKENGERCWGWIPRIFVTVKELK